MTKYCIERRLNHSMIQFFGQLMKLPLEAFIYSMDMLVKTMRGIQQIAFQGIDMVADGSAQPLVDASGADSDSTTDVTYDTIRDSAETAQQMPQEEERTMSDRDLRGDDELKLVRYKILFVKRDYEGVLLHDQEELVHDNITEDAYVAWKIAEFIQKLSDRKTPVPTTWKSYPDDRDAQGNLKYRVGNILTGLPEEDKKYLRVYYEVLERYAREKFRHDEEQIKVLREIRDKLEDKVVIEREQVAVLRRIRSGVGPEPDQAPTPAPGQAPTGGGQTSGGSSST